MAALRGIIDALLRDVTDQLPTMQVRKITVEPPDPVAGEDVTARIEVSDTRYVLCAIRTGHAPGEASLSSARVIES